MEKKCSNCVFAIPSATDGFMCKYHDIPVSQGHWCCKFKAFVQQAYPDPVNHPSHYTQGKVECIDAIESATINKKGIEAVCTANVIKYLWRYENKNGLEDLKKAEFYLNRLIEVNDKR